MNKNIVLSNLLFAQNVLSSTTELGGSSLERLRGAVNVAIEALHEQPELITPETAGEAANLLIRALQPFAAIDAPEQYKDTDAVAVEIAVPQAFVEKYIAAYDNLIAMGQSPSYARPDLMTKANWPTQVLNLDGVNIGDIRFAKKALETVTTSEENIVN